MTSKTIYQEIKPTYLYIKQHSITKKKYFGKTTKKDPYKYSGSGSYWLRHYKKYGKEHIKTIWVSDLYYDTSIVDIALHFSHENNIVESNDWANLKPENGLNGGCTLETARKILDTRKKNNTGASNPNIIQKGLDTRKKNGTLIPTPESIQKQLETRIQNGTMNNSSPESIQKQLDTKKKNGTMNSNTPESIQKCKDTKKKNGTGMYSPNAIQKRSQTKLERTTDHPSKIPFLSIITSKKTYAKNCISKYYPEFKKYF